MPFNRVSAMGVQHGLVSQEDQFNAQRSDAMKRAQMAALMAGSGGGAPRPDGGLGNDQFARDFDATHPQGSNGIGAGGLPLDQIAAFDRQAKAGMDMQGLQGSQAMDLQKQRGADSLALGNVQMGPANKRADLETRAYNDSSGLENERRSIGIQALKQASGLLGGMGDSSAPDAGGSDKWDHLAALGALANGGQMPDFGSRDAQRQMLQMSLQEAKRKSASGQTQDFLAAGDVAGAENAATAGGVPMPRQSFDAVSADPQVTGKITQLIKLIDDNDLYFTDANQGQLDAVYNELNTLIESMRASPEAKTRLLQMVKDKMRNAVTRNTSLFQGAGMGSIEDKYLK